MNNTEKKDKFLSAKQQMIEFDLKGRDITNPSVLSAMSEVPREAFIPDNYISQAYADGPLPVGLGQTISQPYIVALMTQALKLKPNFEVLEIGTGSGYQSAILSRIVKKVYTIERYAKLSESAQAILGRLGFNNIEFYIGDGSCGWPEKKEFDRIIITAAVPKIPEPVLEQLDTGGIIVAPVGFGFVQKLIVCEKKKIGCVEKSICDVRFVKLIGEYGFKK